MVTTEGEAAVGLTKYPASVWDQYMGVITAASLPSVVTTTLRNYHALSLSPKSHRSSLVKATTRGDEAAENYCFQRVFGLSRWELSDQVPL